MAYRIPQIVLALTIVTFATVSLAGVVFIEGTAVYLQVSATVSSLLMFAASWFVSRASRVAVLLLLVAAVVYFLSMVVPAYSRHGMQAFAQLIPAFYLSLLVRVGFALCAHFLLNRVAAR